MKIKSIYKKEIWIHGEVLKPGEEREIDEKTQEISNLAKQKYIEIIEKKKNEKTDK